MESINIILIVIDTLRKDYANSLGERLRRFGFISYDNVIAPAPWTMPTHASIFTGVYPIIHGAHETKKKKGFGIQLKSKELLSVRLSELEYKTYLVTANPYIRPSLGFIGFSNFYESSGWEPRISFMSPEDVISLADLRNEIENNDIKSLIKVLLMQDPRLLLKVSVSRILYHLNPLYIRIVAKTRKWPIDKGADNIVSYIKQLRYTPKTPLFIFINLMEVHEPYFIGDNASEVRKNILTGSLSPGYIEKWKHMYPKEVEYVSKKIIELINVFKKKGLFDNSLIIITSDHGQLLGEHGRIGHGTFLYDELLKVPLFIKYPQGTKVDRPTSENPWDYISLTRLKHFILDFVEHNTPDVTKLYSNIAFSESYGIGGITVTPKTEEEKRNVRELEKYRIAIYYKNFKGIFNVTDWKFERIVSYNPNIEVTEDVVKHMRKAVVRFLKTATVTKVPEINV